MARSWRGRWCRQSLSGERPWSFASPVVYAIGKIFLLVKIQIWNEKKIALPARDILTLLRYREFGDDPGFDVDAFCEGRQRDAFIVAVHTFQVVLRQGERP